MPKYIDADALIEAIKHELWDWQIVDDITATTVLKQTITDIQNAPTADVVERKDLDEITEAHEQNGYEKGFRDGYAQAIEDAIKAVGLNTWAGSRISQLPTTQMNERREDVSNC